MIRSRTASTLLAAAAVAAMALPLAGCSKSAPAPVAPAQPTAPAGPGIPKIPDAKMAEVKAAFDAAAKLVAQADQFRSEGQQIAREEGGEAANDTLLKARKLYREAIESTEEWIEPELGPFTQAQIDAQLRMYVSERGAWIKKSASLGKLHD